MRSTTVGHAPSLEVAKKRNSRWTTPRMQEVRKVPPRGKSKCCTRLTDQKKKQGNKHMKQKRGRQKFLPQISNHINCKQS